MIHGKAALFEAIDHKRSDLLVVLDNHDAHNATIMEQPETRIKYRRISFATRELGKSTVLDGGEDQRDSGTSFTSSQNIPISRTARVNWSKSTGLRTQLLTPAA